MGDIYYMGLIGSRLWGNDCPDSDNDWLILSKDQKPEVEWFMPEIDGDRIYIHPDKFLSYIFFTSTEDLYIQGFHQAIKLTDWVFSKPIYDSPFSNWLIKNRELIVKSNLNYWKYVSISEAAHIIEQTAYPDSQFLCYTFPKNMMKAWIRMRPALKYPTTLNWEAATSLTPEEKDIANKMRYSKISNLEILNILKEDLSKVDDDFYDVVANPVINERLFNEAKSFFV